jgi:hypothetical protein
MSKSRNIHHENSRRGAVRTRPVVYQQCSTVAHSFAALFDAERMVTVSGTVTLRTSALQRALEHDVEQAVDERAVEGAVHHDEPVEDGAPERVGQHIDVDART